MVAVQVPLCAVPEVRVKSPVEIEDCLPGLARSRETDATPDVASVAVTCCEPADTSTGFGLRLTVPSTGGVSGVLCTVNVVVPRPLRSAVVYVWSLPALSNTSRGLASPAGRAAVGRRSRLSTSSWSRVSPGVELSPGVEYGQNFFGEKCH
jgi:hypothetical protein